MTGLVAALMVINLVYVYDKNEVKPPEPSEYSEEVECQDAPFAKSPVGINGVNMEEKCRI